MPTTEIGQEQRVDAMIAEGRRIVDAAVAEYRPVAIVAAYSGGDDSVVSTHFTISHYPDSFAFNADTMIGLKPAREHIARTCERFGWGLEVGRATPEGCPKRRRLGGRMVPFVPARDLVAGEWRDGVTAYEEFALNHGFPGRGKPQHARMFQRLKERPIRGMLRRFKASKVEGRPKVLIVSGIRGDESAVRAGYKRAVGVGYFGDVWVNPFYWRGAADFAAYRDEFGLPANPAKPRCGISGECCCQTFPNEVSSLAAYRSLDPEFGRYVDRLESKVREVFPWGYGESPPRWWMDQKRGQGFLFPIDERQKFRTFQPMCVGCHRGK